MSFTRFTAFSNVILRKFAPLRSFQRLKIPNSLTNKTCESNFDPNRRYLHRSRRSERNFLRKQKCKLETFIGELKDTLIHWHRHYFILACRVRERAHVPRAPYQPTKYLRLWLDVCMPLLNKKKEYGMFQFSLIIYFPFRPVCCQIWRHGHIRILMITLTHRNRAT